MRSEGDSPTFSVRALASGVAIAASIALLGAGGAGAQSISELNSKIASARSQVDQIGAEIQAKTEQLAAARRQAAAAAAREAELTGLLARGEEREAELQAKVERTRARLEATRARLRRSLRALADRLVAIYEGNSPDPTELLLSSHGFDDLANRAELLGRIQRADDALAERVRVLKREVAAQLAAANAAHAQAVAYDRRIAAARDQIAAVRANAVAQAAALDAARQQEQSALAGLQSQVSTWQQQVEQARQVSAQQAQQTVSNWLGQWAIPEAIVMCESGGNFRAVNPTSGAGGAYQILPSTWRMYGQSGLPQDASASLQTQVASQIWQDSGPSAWACAH
jgi:peptidoglycan hydrolase CwlO-like protein